MKLHSVREFSLDTERFLGTKENPATLYARPSEGLIYSPFDLKVYEMERLIVVNFEGDPTYRIAELQYLDNELGKGAVVLLYHNDGRVSVYCQGKMDLSADVYHWGPNWETVGETDIDSKLEITEEGVSSHLRMTDRYGKSIEFSVQENTSNIRWQNVLSPLGRLALPEFFFFFFYSARFSPVDFEAAQIKIVIDGQERKPAVIPIKISGKKRYLTRYIGDPFMALVNRNFSGTLTPMEREEIVENSGRLKDNEYTFVENSGHLEISQVCGRTANHRIYFLFSPPIPDLVCLRNGARTKGRFTCGADENRAPMGGNYSIKRSRDRIRMVLKPTKGWQPHPGRLWLKAFRWYADMSIGDGDVSMESHWKVSKGCFLPV